MTIRVSSGNSATVTLQRSGSRFALDVEWTTPHTPADIEELNQLLHLGDQAFNITIQDDVRRGEVLRDFLAHEVGCGQE